MSRSLFIAWRLGCQFVHARSSIKLALKQSSGYAKRVGHTSRKCTPLVKQVWIFRPQNPHKIILLECTATNATRNDGIFRVWEKSTAFTAYRNLKSCMISETKMLQGEKKNHSLRGHWANFKICLAARTRNTAVTLESQNKVCAL